MTAPMITPRTDAAVIPNADLSDQGHGDSPYVYADFARELERDILDLTEKCAKQAAVIDELKKDKERLEAVLDNIQELAMRVHPSMIP